MLQSLLIPLQLKEAHYEPLMFCRQSLWRWTSERNSKSPKWWEKENHSNKNQNKKNNHASFFPFFFP